MTDAPLASTQLPIIDFAGGLTNRDRDPELARAIDAAFSGVGFCYFVNTGVPQALMDRIFAASKSFHALSAERKAAIKMNGAEHLPDRDLIGRESDPPELQRIVHADARGS
jgi:isopenicillin N synthase-like dioxygenase